MPTSRKTKTTHDALIQAARAVVARTGSLSPDAVAETAGVSTATFYAYFSSKDALLAAAFDQAVGETNRFIKETMSIEALLEHGLDVVARNVVEGLVEMSAEDANLVRLVLARLSGSEDVRETYRRRELEALATIARFIRLASAAGQIPDGEPEVLARMVLVILQGSYSPLLPGPDRGRVVAKLVVMLRALLEDSHTPGRSVSSPLP